MELQGLFSEMQQSLPELLSSYCIVNGAVMNLDEIQKMGYDEFSFRSKLNMPLKLYRYYPNRMDPEKKVNYSLQALRDNTVFLSSPLDFDDVYDSEISIEFEEFQRLRLLEYCKRCGIQINEDAPTQELGDALVTTLYQFYMTHNTLEGVFTNKPDCEKADLVNQVFLNCVLVKCYETHDLGRAVANAIQEEYADYSKYLKSVFRIACFATTPYSQLMWGGAYADNSKGFCLEYTVLPEDDAYHDIYYNLFPMIYCKVRPDITRTLVKAKDQDISRETLWNIYSHGVLRKSIDWAFQNEWRLLLPIRSKNTEDYNVKFFPITKVYLGNRMPVAQRKEIIEICHEKNIPYVGVKRNPHIFEMQDCEMKCEDCPSLHTH